MRAEKFLEDISTGILSKSWHWYVDHARRASAGAPTAFFVTMALIAERADRVVPGFGAALVERIVAVGGRERDNRDYEQLLQIVAEGMVVSHIILFEGWPAGTSFELEPVAEGSAKNPELVVRGPAGNIGIEVKAPGLLDHRKRRREANTQATYRGDFPLEGKVVLPRDNPIKDFLISADQKFDGFRRADPDFVGVLVIVWDDAVYEPIAALIHPGSGLLTPNTYLRDDAGEPVTFPSISVIVPIRHQDQIMAAAAGQPLMDGCEHVFDYGRPGFPFKVGLPGGSLASLPKPLIECLQLLERDDRMGAEYGVLDMVWWSDAGAY